MTRAEGKPRRSSSAHSRELGAYLRMVRQQAGKTVDDLLDVLGWSAGKLSKLEAGTRGTSPHEIALFLGVCGAEQEVRDRVMALVEAVDTGSFLRPHEASADDLFGLRVHEQQATAITTYDPVGVPSLAQTADYALALSDTDTVAARMDRQAHSARRVNRPVIFYVSEAALGSVVGSPAVMRDQLLYLTRLAHTTNIVVRVVPRARGLHEVLQHPATLLTLAAPHRPVVYVETYAATVFHDDPQVVASYRHKMDRLSRLALSMADSQQLIAHWLHHHDAAHHSTSD
ncbi:helix-turn-helix domain-containing protein [Saccharothrix sp. HUAS TT1]|uniref:helix-turn-helix domain-containing protein n=1 Tax=unclassified Saccharothrix TaxID=2593673 RepID=UPI00345B74CC